MLGEFGSRYSMKDTILAETLAESLLGSTEPRRPVKLQMAGRRIPGLFFNTGEDGVIVTERFIGITNKGLTKLEKLMWRISVSI